jgi:hypothetical protein
MEVAKRVLFAVMFSLGVALSPIALAQSTMDDPPGIIVGLTDGGYRYMTGGIGSDEREVMENWAAPYNLKLIFAERSGFFVAGVKLSILDEPGDEIAAENANGPWFYIKLPPGLYTVVAIFEDDTKQIRDLQIVGQNPVTRFFHWERAEAR